MLYVISWAVRRVRFETILKYHVQIMLLFVYTTTRKRFVIFTCKYFKLSWNTTALSQSNCRKFSCSSIKYIIQFLFLERNRGKLLNYLPHWKFPSTLPSPQLSYSIDLLTAGRYTLFRLATAAEISQRQYGNKWCKCVQRSIRNYFNNFINMMF